MNNRASRSTTPYIWQKAINFLKLNKMKILVALFVTFFSFADTEILSISGDIGEILEIEIVERNGNGDPQNLNLLTDRNNFRVAYAFERSNNPSGYRVFVRSVGDSQLLHSSLTSPTQATAQNSIPYTLKYGNRVITNLTTTDVLARNHNRPKAGGQRRKAVRLSYTAVDPAQMLSGIYTDTLTFTIQAN